MNVATHAAAGRGAGAAGQGARVFYYVEAGAFGGAARSLLGLMAGLDRARFSPVVLGAMPDRLADALGELEVPVVRLPAVGSKRDVRAWAAVIAAVRRSRPVVFHAMVSHPYAAPYGILAAIVSRVPVVVVTVHAFWPPDNRRQAWMSRQLYRGVDAELVASRWARARLEDAGGLAGRVEVVPNGITPSVLVERGEARAALGLPADAPVVGSAMRLEQVKRPDLVVEIGNRLPGVHVVLIGEGPERDRLAAQAESPNLHLTGFRNDAAELLRALDVFVSPCPVENQPLAVLEAMAAGVPVVGADEGGVAELVDHGRTGLLASVTAEAMADGAARLLADRELGRRLAEAAAAEVGQRFTLAATTARIEAIYSDLLETSI